MARYAERLLGELIAGGRCEVVGDYAKPFALLVVAELEGVPEEDHPRFAEGFRSVSKELAHKPLEFLYEQFSAYIEDRRAAPRDDIMTKMATATFPDGSTPEVRDVALLAANLFTGGQETTVRLLSFALRLIAERTDLQERLRADRDLIPGFIEETLRYESPLRSQYRMAKVRTEVAGVDIPAGSTVLLLPGAANRDPRKFEDPATFDPERENAIYHLAFGHGIHHCAGAHLARAEGRVTLNRILDLTSEIAIDESAHGPADDRRWEYLPTYFLRGLQRLELTLTPA
jgi:cytochrome P450